MADIKIEVDTRYLTRDGTLVDIVDVPNPNGRYPFAGHVVGMPDLVHWWNESGSYFSSHHQNRNIIEKVGDTSMIVETAVPSSIKAGGLLTVKKDISHVMLDVEDRDNPLQIIVMIKGKPVRITTIINPSEKG